MKGLAAVVVLVVPSTIAMVGGDAFADAAEVAVSPAVVVSAAPSAAAPPPASAPPAAPPPASEPRRGWTVGFADNAVVAAAIDGRWGRGVMGRLEGDVYGVLVLEDASFFIGGPVIAIEMTRFAELGEIALPALLTTGLRMNHFIGRVAVGPIIAGPLTADRSDLSISPRVDLRAGYRNGGFELEGMLGYEHHIVLDQSVNERVFFGMSIGGGG